MTEACKPLTLSLALAACDWWSYSAHPKCMCYKVHKSTGSCQSVSIHFTVHRAGGEPLFSSVQVPVRLCRTLSVLDVFWFWQDLHLLPSIAPFPESPCQPLSSSFPTKNKEWSELKESKIVNQFRDRVFVLPPFLGAVRVRVKEQYSEGGQRLLLKKQ